MKKIVSVITILLVINFLFLIGFFLLRFEYAKAFNVVSYQITQKNPSEINKSLLNFSLRNDIFRDYLESEGVEKEKIYFEEDNLESTYKTMSSIVEEANQANIDISVYALNFATEERVEVIPKAVVEQKDKFLPKEISYTISGKDGQRVYDDDVTYKIENKDSSRNLNFETLVNQIDPIDEVVYTGDLTNEVFFNSITKEINYPNTSAYKIDFIDDLNARDESFKLGKLSILYDNCSYYINTSIQYNYKENSFDIKEKPNLQNYECESSISYPKPVELAICEDCKLFPVDKNHRLPKDYVPNVTSLSSFSSPYQLGVEAIEDFTSLWDEILANGFNPFITSAYRSFENQEETFAYWTNREISIYGLGQAEAEERANTFSARPGFSEHQLGTTLDINAIECQSFEGTCPYNEKFWKWLDDNAYKFGFIRSYPEGKEAETGYVSEGWHYRWLGVELATEYKTNPKGLTLNNWLESRREF